jgi:hypothetical protein
LCRTHEGVWTYKANEDAMDVVSYTSRTRMPHKYQKVGDDKDRYGTTMPMRVDNDNIWNVLCQYGSIMLVYLADMPAVIQTSAFLKVWSWLHKRWLLVESHERRPRLDHCYSPYGRSKIVLGEMECVRVASTHAVINSVTPDLVFGVKAARSTMITPCYNSHASNFEAISTS